ncbi:MAG: hypothetical protein M3460_16435 [Actinomycetota bacterium]|nr:hypothetical protein [Actinomycetota bacterium]
MAQQREPQDQHRPNDAAIPVPNRRERRGGKSGAAVTRGKSAVGRRSAPVVPPRQYSTRRRSG